MSHVAMGTVLVLVTKPFIRGVWRGVLGMWPFWRRVLVKGSLMKPLMNAGSVVVEVVDKPSGIDAVRGGDRGALPVCRGRMDDLADSICAREISDGVTVCGCCVRGLF